MVIRARNLVQVLRIKQLALEEIVELWKSFDCQCMLISVAWDPCSQAVFAWRRLLLQEDCFLYVAAQEDIDRRWSGKVGLRHCLALLPKSMRRSAAAPEAYLTGPSNRSSFVIMRAPYRIFELLFVC
jgi:hypothetical protein